MNEILIDNARDLKTCIYVFKNILNEATGKSLAIGVSVERKLELLKLRTEVFSALDNFFTNIENATHN